MAEVKRPGFFKLLKMAFGQWYSDQVMTLGAALSYYTIFSMAPLLVLIIAIAGFAFGEQAARGEIVGTMQGLVGHTGAVAVQSMIVNARKPERGITATILGLVVLLLGASSVFAQLQSSMNLIWRVESKPGATLRMFIKQRILSFAMIVAIGFLLLVSLAISAGLSAAGKYFGTYLPGSATLWHIVNSLISFLIITGLFGLIFKVLPDASIAWKDVWIGALLTSFLFTVGKFLIGLYLGNSSISSAYGAAGSLAVLLVWVYYSSQIVFFGAEFAQVYATRRGAGVMPQSGARLMLVNPMTHQRAPIKSDEITRAGTPHKKK